jgi:hypothetical protein
MKGLVFTVFLEMVEEKYGYNVLDKIIVSSSLDSKGAYTSVGTYDHKELFVLIQNLFEITNESPNLIFKNYGEFAFAKFAIKYSYLLKNANDLFSFLESIETYIHVEVLKLYPDAELPRFETIRVGNNKLILKYISKRRMSDFAEGLLAGSINHFDSKTSYTKEIFNEGEEVIFTLTNN